MLFNNKRKKVRKRLYNEIWMTNRETIQYFIRKVHNLRVLNINQYSSQNCFNNFHEKLCNV